MSTSIIFKVFWRINIFVTWNNIKISTNYNWYIIIYKIFIFKRYKPKSPWMPVVKVRWLGDLDFVRGSDTMPAKYQCKFQDWRLLARSYTRVLIVLYYLPNVRSIGTETFISVFVVSESC